MNSVVFLRKVVFFFVVRLNLTLVVLLYVDLCISRDKSVFFIYVMTVNTRLCYNFLVEFEVFLDEFSGTVDGYNASIVHGETVISVDQYTRFLFKSLRTRSTYDRRPQKAQRMAMGSADALSHHLSR